MTAVSAAEPVFDTDRFDPSVIDNLLGIMAKNAVRALLLDVKSDVLERLDRLAEINIASNSLALVAQDAHDLKSMGGNFGLLELSQHAGIIERAARSGCVDTVKSALPTLILAGKQSIECLDAHPQLSCERAS